MRLPEEGLDDAQLLVRGLGSLKRNEASGNGVDVFARFDFEGRE
jgi:hypothetical protein